MNKCILMMGTSPRGRGGIASVIDLLLESELARRWPIQFVPTHSEGSKLKKVAIALSSWLTLLWGVVWGRIGLLHVHTASGASFWRKSAFVVPAIIAKIPVVLHLHGGGFNEFYWQESSPLAQRAIRWILRNSSRVIVLSDQWMAKLALIEPYATTVVISNPVELVDVPSSYLGLDDHNIIAFLGRIEKDKGIYELFNAVALLLPKFPNILLAMAGEGEIEKAKAVVRDLGLSSNVSFLGWVNGKGKSELLSKASLFVLPSYMEGLPMGVLEAMAAGLPIVATNVGGIPDVITDGENGFLVHPKDDISLAKAIGEILCDTSLAARMGQIGKSRAKNEFSLSAVIEKIEKLYVQLGVYPLEKA